ncbi:DUF4135 domain-containing protein [Pseudoroseomonas wenyumeiae]
MGPALFGGAAVGALTDIAVTDSDPHNGGRRVMILTFKGPDGRPLKAVHKPRDVRVDARIVGRTGQQSNGASLSERATSLSERANDLMMAAERRRLLQKDPQAGEQQVESQVAQNITLLPTYGFLARQDAQDSHYGWVEFVEHGRPQDCVLDRPAAEAFYRCAGQLAGLAFLCGIEDLHHGNLLVRDGLPVLTDLEIAFGSKAEPPAGFDPVTASDDEVKSYAKRQLDKTLLSMALSRGMEKQYNVPVAQHDRLDFPSGVQTSTVTDNFVFLKKENGELQAQTEGLAHEFAGSFGEGFQRICDAFSNPAFREANEAFLEGFADMDVRFHALATPDQLNLRYNAMLQGYRHSINEEATQLASGTLRKNDHFGSRLLDAPWQEALIPDVAHDLARRDVAYFTQRLGTRELMHNGRTPVSHNDNTALLPHDGLEVARRNLRLMIHHRAILREQAVALAWNTPSLGQLPDMEELKKRYKNA